MSSAVAMIARLSLAKTVMPRYLSLLCLICLGCSKQIARPSSASAAVQTADDVRRLQIQSAGEASLDSQIPFIDLGTIGQGESTRREIIVRNPTGELVTIDRIEPSCECLTINGVPVTIHPSEEQHLELVIDGSREREFHGALGIRVVAYQGKRAVLEFEARLVIAQVGI